MSTRRSSADPTNANVQAFLATIRHSEGTDGYPDPWGTYYGGGQFTNKADHPVNTGEEQPVQGPSGQTTAAGAYQIELSTWEDLGGVGHYGDFSDGSQDAAALDLIERAGQTDNMVNGNFADAVAGLGNVWASLPGSQYGQPTADISDLVNFYQQAGGQIATA